MIPPNTKKKESLCFIHSFICIIDKYVKSCIYVSTFPMVPFMRLANINDNYDNHYIVVQKTIINNKHINISLLIMIAVIRLYCYIIVNSCHNS
ncbi:hypothetical protein BDA99DRAFT_524164 [Phascolomyces articulosus]|uniref:Uncharacterized protein n=1 Tax=Phascolomyces articulosus TaxID=60185 RepID=A0AAD5JPV4_9FUNG|nr:hypothetical protein BDA99DRAFT_524164 [Phascolomyces articulosus]